MILGFLMLGIVSGAICSVAALIAGHGLLAAVAIYMVTGMAVTLTGAVLAFASAKNRDGRSGEVAGLPHLRAN